MKWFNFENKHTDERIINTRNSIYKEIYSLVAILCIASAIFKTIKYGTQIEVIATELLILIVSALYYTYRSVRLGVYSDIVEVHDRTSKYPMSIKNVVMGLGLGIGLAIYFGVRSALLYAEGGPQALYYFMIVFVVALIIYIPFLVTIMTLPHAWANKVSKRRNREELDE
ncbi:DUF6773 family protein [Paenibacillus agricola]|uniref:TRAP-type C4-dicarboxylate transport system permease small subunit n=1 Tax=Paenibacillus agricola TaxID=2716264 RepID=A0ABX0J2W9_9BACL|nr:DUF6773 family protein [Paenibacillus agricola]NHN30629.1 hypothetical protein [Paenibacillus agricola]